MKVYVVDRAGKPFLYAYHIDESGKKVWRSTGTRDRRAAERFAWEWEALKTFEKGQEMTTESHEIHEFRDVATELRSFALKFDGLAFKLETSQMDAVNCHMATIYNYLLPQIEDKLVRLEAAVTLEIHAKERGLPSPAEKRVARAKREHRKTRDKVKENNK